MSYVSKMRRGRSFATNPQPVQQAFVQTLFCKCCTAPADLPKVLLQSMQVERETGLASSAGMAGLKCSSCSHQSTGFVSINTLD
jgi:hypothetical protein